MCSTLTGSEPLKFTWLHNGVLLPKTENIFWENSDKFSVLKLQKIHPNLAGNLSCEVSNFYGRDSGTILLTVKGLHSLTLCGAVVFIKVHFSFHISETERERETQGKNKASVFI